MFELEMRNCTKLHIYSKIYNLKLSICYGWLNVDVECYLP